MTDAKAPITDLRTPTPYTFTNTITGISGCAASPTTGSVYVTAIVDGTPYPAFGPEIQSLSTASTVLVPITFPDLIVTILTPGQEITLVSNEANSWRQFNL
jgi:hypothetical protein